jgi:hypothetical protein
VHGTLQPELRKSLGFTRAGTEAGAPEQALGLRLAELATVDGRHRTSCIGAKAPCA